MTRGIPLLVHAALFAAFATFAQAQKVVYGDSGALGNGMVRTWVEVDSDDVPLRIGLHLTESALSNLPLFDRVMSLDLPEVAVDSLFRHILFDWVPNGHMPSSLYGRPHFDFHFYMIPAAERRVIPEGMDNTTISPEFMPQDYVAVPGVGFHSVSQMGVHFSDTEAPELSGQPFTKTLIYGFSAGAMIFVEPMITRAYLLTHPADILPIKQPQSYQRSGYYPTTYRIDYDADRQVFDVVITDFLSRSGVATANEEPEAALPQMHALSQNFPNPFHSTTTIRYQLGRSAHVIIGIYDLLGQRIRTLVDAMQPAGGQNVVWDGRNDHGEVVSAGVYLARMSVGEEAQSNAIVLTR